MFEKLISDSESWMAMLKASNQSPDTDNLNQAQAIATLCSTQG